MAFEKFTKVGGSYQTKASIRSNGQIGFSQGSIKRYELVKYKFATLYFDKDTEKVGVKLTNDANEEGICKLQVRGSNAAVSAKAFLDYYNIEHNKTKSYQATWDDTEKMIIVSLKS